MKDEAVEELIDNNTTYLSQKERDIILFNVRKIVTDLNSMKLYTDQYGQHISAADANRIEQYIKNNITRSKTILWQLTSMSFKKNKKG